MLLFFNFLFVDCYHFTLSNSTFSLYISPNLHFKLSILFSHLELGKLSEIISQKAFSCSNMNLRSFKSLDILQKNAVPSNFKYLKKLNSKNGRKFYYSQKLCFDNFFEWKEYNFLSGYLTNMILNFCQECSFGADPALGNNFAIKFQLLLLTCIFGRLWHPYVCPSGMGRSWIFLFYHFANDFIRSGLVQGPICA